LPQHLSGGKASDERILGMKALLVTILLMAQSALAIELNASDLNKEYIIAASVKAPTPQMGLVYELLVPQIIKFVPTDKGTYQVFDVTDLRQNPKLIAELKSLKLNEQTLLQISPNFGVDLSKFKKFDQAAISGIQKNNDVIYWHETLSYNEPQPSVILWQNNTLNEKISFYKLKWFMKRYEPLLDKTVYIDAADTGSSIKPRTLITKIDGVEKRFLPRWSLKKSIEVKVSCNYPEQLKPAVPKAAKYWNRVFGKTVLVMSKSCASEDESTATLGKIIVSYNPSYLYFMNFGPIQVDPRTGEILSAYIHVSAQSNDIKTWSTMYAQVAALADPDKLKISQDQAVLIWHMGMLTHEMGHTLGLAHNFAGSLGTPLSLTELKLATKRFLEGETENLPTVTASIMDYNDEDGIILADYDIYKERTDGLVYDKQAIRNIYFSESKPLPFFCSSYASWTPLGCLTNDGGNALVENYVQGPTPRVVARNILDFYTQNSNAESISPEFLKQRLPSPLLADFFNASEPELKNRFVVRGSKIDPNDLNQLINKMGGVNSSDVQSALLRIKSIPKDFTKLGFSEEVWQKIFKNNELNIQTYNELWMEKFAPLALGVGYKDYMNLAPYKFPVDVVPEYRDSYCGYIKQLAPLLSAENMDVARQVFSLQKDCGI
jgi:hypothetical protein